MSGLPIRLWGLLITIGLLSYLPAQDRQTPSAKSSGKNGATGGQKVAEDGKGKSGPQPLFSALGGGDIQHAIQPEQ